MADELKPPIAASPAHPASPQSMGDGDTASVIPPLASDTNPDAPAPISESADDPNLSMGERKTPKPAGSADDSSQSALAEIDRKVFAERFDFIAELGVGGMGRVLKAFDRKMGREVAVKRIKGDFADGSKLWKRFLREAKLAARLSHPNLVTVFDILADDEGPYLVLEYIDGESLAERLKRGSLEWREAVKLLLPVCLGVAAAHERGVIHRDIKPGNILLPRSGSPKLGDFGIARASDSTDLTRTQASLGTPDYMAPEQGVDTKDVDPRADLYSLAATLYHMVTGNRPRLILVEDVPADLRPLVRQGLQQNREKRQESVLAFVEQLERCLTPQVVIPDPDVESLTDGQCPQCRIINPPQRKFCRKCNSALQEPCPACQQTTYAWDRFCGECSVDLADEWEKFEQSIAEKSERFHSLTAEHDYPAANALLDELASLKGQRWSKWRTWAAESRTWLETERAERIRWCDDLVAAAQLDFEEARYEQALARLEQIPRGLLTVEASSLLDQGRQRQQELTKLLAALRELVNTKDYAAIRTCIDAIFAISPNDRRISELDQQLRDRETRLRREAEEQARHMPPPLLKSPFSAEQARAGQQAWAKFLRKPVVEQNSIGLELTLIPPGEFLMGSPDSEAERRDDETQHGVRLTQPFRLGTYPVLQREFQQVLGRNPSHFSPSGGGKAEVERVDCLRLPVEEVSWFDAVEFCNKLSEREGLSPYYGLQNVQRDGAAIKSADVNVSGGNGYRLPTEAEWEYACRAGTTSAYHFGNVNNGQEANIDGNYPYGTTTKGPYLERTSVVGSYLANSFGLYDMHGNVWEWCGDWYDTGFYGQASGTVVDPFNAKPADFRVHRGGSWISYAWGTRSAFRGWYAPGSRGYNIGLRIARTE